MSDYIVFDDGSYTATHHPDGEDPVDFGPFPTAAEAFDALVAVGVTNIDDVVLSIPPFYTTKISFNPLFPISIDSLPPQPSNIDLPALENSEFIRLVRGEFAGLHVTASIAATGTGKTHVQKGDAEDACNCYTTTNVDLISDTASLSIDYPVNRAFSCYHRDCRKCKMLSGNFLAADPIMQFLDLGLSGVEAVPLTYLDTGNTTYTRSSSTTTGCTPRDPYSSSVTRYPQPVYFDSVSSDVVIGFFRKGNKAKLVFRCGLRSYGFIGVGDSSNVALWVFAPTTGLDFHTFYAIPNIPTSDDIYTYTEISTTTTLFGIEMTVWGWKQDVNFEASDTSDDSADGCERSSVFSGFQTYVPALEIEEL